MMGKTKIVVPEGMLKAAEQALSLDQDQFRRWLAGDVDVPCPGANGYPLLLMLRAALRWMDGELAEMCLTNTYPGKLTSHAAMVEVWREGIQDVRRMFAPAQPDPQSFDTPFGRVVVDPRVPPGEIRMNHWNGPTLLRCAPPKPEAPEAVKDLLHVDSSRGSSDEWNAAIIEAHRRGLEERKDNSDVEH